MGLQKRLVKARQRRRIGERARLLVDGPAGEHELVLKGRLATQAPDIDSVVFVHGEELHPGQFVTVRVNDFQAYDLVAEIPASKSRRLKVLAS